MNRLQTILDTVQALYSVGWASQKLGYPIDECPYLKHQRERFFWVLGYQDAETAGRELSVFDMLPLDGECRNDSCSF